MDEDYAKKIREAAQQELDELLKKFENDFTKTVERIKNIDIEVDTISNPSLNNNSINEELGEEFRGTIAGLINQQFRRQKTPLERQVNRIGSRLFNSVFSNYFGDGSRTADFNPSANSGMRLSQSQSAFDIFSILSSSKRNS